MRRTGLASIIAALLLACSLTSLNTGHARGQGATFQGSQKGTQGPVSLHAGLVIVRGQSNGSANFTVSLATQDPGATVENSFNNRYLLIDAIGAYKGAAATIVRQDGSYFLDIGQASGAYQLTVEQPSPSTVQPSGQTSFSGQKQQVTQYFSLPPGNYTVTATSDSNALRVRLYTIDALGGAAVVSPSTGYYGDELMDTTIPPGLTSVPVTLQSL